MMFFRPDADVQAVGIEIVDPTARPVHELLELMLSGIRMWPCRMALCIGTLYQILSMLHVDGRGFNGHVLAASTQGGHLVMVRRASPEPRRN
jgi:hypothetical protein